MEQDFKKTIDTNYGNKLRVRICALIIQENKLLLIKHKAKTPSNYLWLPPGGGLEFGETMEQAFSREILEETNLTVTKGPFYDLTEYIADPIHALELFFIAQNIQGEITTGIDPELSKSQQLILDLKWMNLEEIERIETGSKHSILRNSEKLKALLHR